MALPCVMVKGERDCGLYVLFADALVLAAGGRFYFAKDSTLHPARLESYLAEERVQRFRALKQQLDPENLLQTDLYRRIFRT